ncbi:MAG: hypothetical protein JXB23_02715 [Candidatus Aminicenantes bacterium]|nr:hypothetical protein [Candidatus Aminicenantes bacterium]
MRKKAFCFVSVLLLGAAVFASFGIRIEPSDEGLSFLLPQSGEVPGWERYDDFQEYEGDDLFFYINGGAEIYHEYGFERVIVQDYKNKNEKSASLEIYAMVGPQSSYGIYSFKTTGEGQPLELGAEGKLQDYYLNFWKGKYLVTITGFDEEQETLEGLKAIACAVDARIKLSESAERPVLTELLPQEGLDAQEVKYFMGNLGLFNSYPFTTKSLFQVKEAVKGSYEGGYDIYLIKYDNEKEPLNILQKAARGLPLEPRYRSVKAEGISLELLDENETYILIKQHKNFIIIILGAQNRHMAARIADGLQDRIERIKKG